MNITPVDSAQAPHAGSLAPLERTRGFGMTPEVPYFSPLGDRSAVPSSEGVIPNPGALQPG
jgi:hypothetical protein